MSRLESPPAEPPVVSPRNSRTLKALVAAAQRMISDGRMAGATIDDIVREADVSKRSFHNHFTDRAALMAQVLDDVRADLEAVIRAINADAPDAATRFTRGMLASWRYGLQNRFSGQVMLHVTAGVADPAQKRNQQLAADLQAGIDSGEFKLPDVDTGVVLILGLSDLGLSRLLRLRDERQRARELMHDICILMLRGLGVDARRQERVVEDALRRVIDAPGPA